MTAINDELILVVGGQSLMALMLGGQSLMALMPSKSVQTLRAAEIRERDSFGIYAERRSLCAAGVRCTVYRGTEWWHG
jgi:hypothetical protein